MKKFTRNFLGDGRGSYLHVLRSFALGLVALVGVHAAANGQSCDPPPGTVHFYADSITPCYNGTNTYEVNVSVMGFENVDTLNLDLAFDESFWTLESSVVTESSFKLSNSNPSDPSGITNQPMTISESGGVINFSWAENVSRGSIPASMTAPSAFAKLTFSIKAFPNNSMASYVNSLVWDKGDNHVGYCIGSVNFTPWNDVMYHDGAITTNMASEAVTVVVVPETVPCAGMKATATVSPAAAGYSYSFNGAATWETFEEGGYTADVYPGDHTVYVMNADECLVKKDFSLEAEGEITHSTDIEHEACDHLGEVTINVSSDKVDVTTYWTVPDLAYQAGKPFSDTYKSDLNKTLVPAGIWWTAVVTECGETTWLRDSVAMGASFVWDGDILVEKASCGMGGEYFVAIDAAKTDSSDVTVQLIDVVNSVLVMDSVFDYAAASPADTLFITDIAPGSYEVRVTDGGDCTGSDMFVILPADDITFDIAHTDVACSDSTAAIWVTEIDGIAIASVTGDYGMYTVGSYKDGEGNLKTRKDTIWDVTMDSITDLHAGVYSAFLFTVETDGDSDPVMGCVVPFDGVNGNEIVLFDLGVVQFEKHKMDVTCAGEDNGKIWITDVERNCETCTEDAVYMARLLDTTGGVAVEVQGWTPIADVSSSTKAFDNLVPAGYMIEVKDTLDGGSCVAFKFESITAPDSLYFIIDSVLAPSCYYGNDGSVRVLIQGGTPPYAYSINDAPNWTDGTAFNLEQGQSYLLQVRDKWGIDDTNYCVFGDTIVVPELDPFIIEAFEATEIECSTDGAQIGVTLIDSTHWATGIKYYYTDTRVEFADPIFPNPVEVRAQADEFTPWTAAKDGKEFEAGHWYIYGIDPFGCVAEDSIPVIGVGKMVIDSVVVVDAACHGTWSGSLTMYVKEGTGIVDSVFYYRYANNPDVLTADPLGERHQWRAFDYDTTGDVPEYVAMSAMTAGSWWLQITDDCTDTILPVIIEDWGAIQLDDDAINVTNVTCNGKANGMVTVDADAVIGGAGEPYFYTLLTYPGNEVVEVPSGTTTIKYEQLAVPEFGKLPAGHYRIVVYDDYGRDQEPEMCPPDTSKMFIVNEPCAIEVHAEVKHVSCADAENGEVYLYMTGGVAGTYGYPKGHGLCQDAEGNEDDGNHYYVTVNNITNPGASFTRMVDDNIDTLVFQTAGGEFDIFVTDELNKEDMEACYADTTVVVYEPEAWTFESIIQHPSDCDTADGVIYVVVEGGFVDTAMWTPGALTQFGAAVVVGGDTIGMSGTYYSGDTLMITDSAFYGQEFELLVVNNGKNLSHYYPLADAQCFGTFKVTMENFVPFSMDYERICASCADSAGGVTVSNITGGFANAYQLQFVSTDSVYDPTNEDKWWPTVTKDSEWLNTSDSVTYMGLEAGDYYIYLRDSSDYTLHKCCRPFPFTVCEPPALILDSVVRRANNTCAGSSDGAFEIFAKGGTPPYKYFYSVTPSADDTFLYPGVPADSLFVDDALFEGMASGAYVGWVMDSLGCIIGCDVDENGIPKDGQRVIIYDAGQLVYSDMEVLGGGCYLNPVDVVYYDVVGGSGDSITVMVKGTAITGDTTTMPWEGMYEVAYTEGMDITLADVPPGNYNVVLETSASCPSAGDTLIVLAGDKFIVDLHPTGGEGCPGDNEIWVMIDVDGGTAPYKYVIKDEDGAIVRDTTVIIDHLLAVGQNYIVEAFDMEGCMVQDSLDIQQPVDVSFDVLNVTCYDDELASAMVVANGTPGREFIVKWEELEGDVIVSSGESDPFMESVRLDTMFVYDDTNINDVHYIFTVVDDQGCEAGLDTITFDKVDGPLQVVNAVKDQQDCVTDFSFEVAGGTAPYMVSVNDSVVEEEIGFFERITVSLRGGDHIVTVLDAHGCSLDYEFEVEFGTERDTMVAYYEGEEGVNFSDAEAGIVDSMLTEGMYEFMYNEGCAILNVDVMMYDAPVVDTMMPGDSIETNHPDLTIVFEGMVEAGMGNITITPLDSLDAPSITVAITEDMVNGDTVTITYVGTEAGYLAYNTTYVVTVDSGAVRAWGGVQDSSWTFTTGSDAITGVNLNPSLSDDFKVYPNPFNDYIRVDNYDKLSRVVVTNIAGQRVLDIENPSYEIRTGNLVTGVYVVTLIQNNNIVKSERIIKR